MRRTSMRGNFRSARVCGRSSATTAASRRATSSDWPTVHGASLRTYGTRKARMPCLRRRTVQCCRSAPRRAAATLFRRAAIAWRVMKVRRFRCSASARCNFRPIAIRSRRTQSLRVTITRICRTSLQADGCVTCRSALLNNLRALRPRRRPRGRHSATCTATAATATTMPVR